MEAGYNVPIGNAEDIVLAYNNVYHRRVSVQPRNVYQSKTFTVPAGLEYGVKLFLADASSGNDLRPYQSTGLTDADRPDAMLFDFGIQHFHMGVGAHPTRPNFKARTDPLLFAMVTEAGIYCIGFYSHGAWSEQALLDIVHEDWPHLLEPFVVKGAIALTQEITDNGLARLRRANVNCFTQRPDGTIHYPPGGGFTASGCSFNSAFEMTKIRHKCDEVEKEIRDFVAEKVKAGEVIMPEKIEFEVVGNQLVGLAPGIKVNLAGMLEPPPL